MNKIFLILVLLFTNNAFSGIKFSGTGSTLALDQANSGLKLQTSMTGFNGVLRLNNTNISANVTNATGAETIAFTQGSSIEQGSGSLNLSGGVFNPGSEILTLSGTEVLVGSSSATIYPDISIASGAAATILGTPSFVSAINLGSSSSVLNLGIQSKLNQDIVLNGGKLVLFNDLSLQDGVRIWGSGTVDVNYRSLNFGAQVNSSVLSQDLTFWRAKDIQLNESVTLAGPWSFLTNSTDNESTINGNGNILTLSGGAQIIVGDATAGHTLYISDLHIKGLSTPPTPNIQTISQSAYLALWQRNDFITQSQWQAYGTAAYSAGFAATYTQDGSGGLSIWDGTSATKSLSPKVYFSRNDYTPGGNRSYGNSTDEMDSLDLVTGGVTFLNNGQQRSVPIDTDEDGNWMKLYAYAGIYDSSGNLLTGSSAYSYFSVAKISTQMIFAVPTTGTQVNKYAGGGSASVDGFTTVYATGYHSIQGVSATTDGYLWIIDYETDNAYHLYKTAGGAKSGSSQAITLPGGYQPVYGTIRVKGTSNSLYAVCVGTPTSNSSYGQGPLFYSTDGVNFTALGDFGLLNGAISNTFAAPAVSVGHQGSIAFVGPSYNFYTVSYQTPDGPGAGTRLGAPYSNAIFVKGTVQTGGKFNLYDGGVTDANRGKVVLSNVTLELAGNYTHSAGHITVQGNNCSIISGGNKTFTVSGTNAPFEVNTVALTYDTTSGLNTTPFAGTAVTLTNGGVVRSATPPGEYFVDANLYNGTTAPTLTQNYNLFSVGGKINVTNTTGAASQTVTINGGNYFWQFPGGSDNALVIAAKTTVTLTNVVLKGFSLANVSFGDGTSGLVFGDGCVLELGADQSLTTGQGAWLFSGNATIRGFGQAVTLNNTDSIRQNVANKTLIISNTVLKSQSNLCLGCASLGTISLTNSSLLINTSSPGFSWSSGNLDINGYSKLGAVNISATGAQGTFNLTTSGQMTVRSGSTLEFGRAVNFAYSPTTTGDTGGATGAIAKRHFALGTPGDASATLYVTNCSIDTTAVPMALDRGNLVADNQVNWTASSTVGSESELGSALNVEILSGGLLNLDGGVKYTISTV